MTSPGDRRRRERKRERERTAYQAALAALPVGSCCGNCGHRGAMPLTREPICTLDSDFEGYVKVNLVEGLCPRWVNAGPSNK